LTRQARLGLGATTIEPTWVQERLLI
jgi:hypothetical protein